MPSAAQVLMQSHALAVMVVQHETGVIRMRTVRQEF